MKRLSFSLLTITILSFIIVHSCSSEEDDTIAPNVVQTPEPEPSAPTQYSLTVTAGEGGTVSSEGGTYDEGTEVTITATANEGYKFAGWEGNDTTSERLTITLNSNQTFQALFELKSEKDYWGETSNLVPEFFFADNISEFHRSGILESNTIITNYFGNYGPIEWWITSFATSQDEINKLREIFCQRRLDKNENWTNPNTSDAPNYDECLSNKWFDYPDNYLLNGTWIFGYNIIVLANGSDEDIFRNFDFQIQLHEYFHAVQTNSILPLPSKGGWGWDIPAFFKEGSAHFYQKYVYRKLLLNGENIDIKPKYLDQNISMREEFRIDMESLKVLCSEITDFFESDNNNIFDCDPYTLGAWGIAFLIDKKGDGDYDSYWKFFYPIIKEKMILTNYNQKSAFSLALKEYYGLTLDEFNEEFKIFLELPIEQQLEIIPDI